jgi:hypothetical protein
MSLFLVYFLDGRTNNLGKVGISADLRVCGDDSYSKFLIVVSQKLDKGSMLLRAGGSIFERLKSVEELNLLLSMG